MKNLRLEVQTLGIALIALLATAAAAPALSGTGSEGRLDELLERGFARLEARQPEAASRLFEEAVALSAGRSYKAQLGLASGLLKADQSAGAARAAQVAEALGATDAQRAAAANLRGLAFFAAGQNKAQLDEAAAALERAIRLDHRAATPARLTLAKVQEAAGEPQAAANLLRQSLAALPEGSRVGHEARVMLCSLRDRHPEIAAPQGAPAGEGGNGPVKISGDEPLYPRAAQRARIEGTVSHQLTVDRDGCVAEVQKLRGLDPQLDAEALKAARQWVFQPATRDGQPVVAVYDLSASFRLTQPPPASRPFLR